MTEPAAPDTPGALPARPAGAAVNSRPAAVALLVLLTLVWGVHWPVVKIGLETMPPLTYAALRLGTGLATVLGVLAAQRKLRLPPRSDLPIVVSVGIAQIAVGVLVMSIALQVVAAGRSSVLVYMMPLCLAVELGLVFGVRPGRADIAGLVLGVAGLAVLLNPAVIDWSRPGELAGTGLLLLNAATWGGVTIHVRRHHWTASPLELQPWQLLVALAPVAAFAFWREGFSGITWNIQTIAVLAYSGPLATGFAFWASQAVTRALGAQVSAMGFLAVPVVGLVSGALMLGEPLGPLDVVAFALILSGVALASLWPPHGDRRLTHTLPRRARQAPQDPTNPR